VVVPLLNAGELAGLFKPGFGDIAGDQQEIDDALGLSLAGLAATDDFK
jgi:hypothetical protein